MMNSEKLAEAIREYRCLWDVSKSSYKDRVKKGNAWKDVASKVNRRVQRCVFHFICSALVALASVNPL